MATNKSQVILTTFLSANYEFENNTYSKMIWINLTSFHSEMALKGIHVV